MVYSGLGWVFSVLRLFSQTKQKLWLKNPQGCIISKPSTYNTIENMYNLLDGLKNQHKSVLGTCWVQTMGIFYQRTQYLAGKTIKIQTVVYRTIHKG